ncbi:unnamed protein product [Xylocopa violacea]|uniref:Uncharacterized protein n=1 Tax=Xylocopa violacea TaxID=135666 RepID=A0ABP1N083_XYLVO
MAFGIRGTKLENFQTTGRRTRERIDYDYYREPDFPTVRQGTPREQPIIKSFDDIIWRRSVKLQRTTSKSPLSSRSP